MIKNKLLVYGIMVGLIPIFYIGPILYILGYTTLALVIGIPCAAVAWPSMFAIASALDNEK